MNVSRINRLTSLLLFAALATPRPGWTQNASPYRVEELARGLKAPWAIAMLPESGGLLLTEKFGGVRLWKAGQLHMVPGGPTRMLQSADSGLLDLLLDPDFTRNHLVYLAFVEGTDSAN